MAFLANPFPNEVEEELKNSLIENIILSGFFKNEENGIYMIPYFKNKENYLMLKSKMEFFCQKNIEDYQRKIAEKIIESIEYILDKDFDNPNKNNDFFYEYKILSGRLVVLNQTAKFLNNDFIEVEEKKKIFYDITNQLKDILEKTKGNSLSFNYKELSVIRNLSKCKWLSEKEKETLWEFPYLYKEKQSSRSPNDLWKKVFLELTKNLKLEKISKLNFKFNGFELMKSDFFNDDKENKKIVSKILKNSDFSSLKVNNNYRYWDNFI